MVCILSGPEHTFEFTNNAHIKVLGFDATGKTVREAQPESVEVHGILDEVYRSGVTAELREIPVTVGSRLRYFDLTYAARKSPDGSVNGVMILGSEITRQVEAREALISARVAADAANQSKTAFLANMSHEIRTPLGAILGFVDLLKDASDQSERDEYARIISRNGKALTKLIDDILDLSKIEAGRLEIEQLDFRLDEVLGDIRELFQENARGKGINFSVNMAAGTPNFLRSDPTRLRQILINLIGNAIKFTSSGFVSLEVGYSRLTSHSASTELRFAISDTGIGMSEVQARRLFEPFTQGDNSMTREYGGSGLGLALARRLAKVLGGDVRIVRCVPREGCTFLATIQCEFRSEWPETVSAEPIISMGVGTIENLKVLLVEDVMENQVLVRRMLNREKIEVDIADNGEAGIEKAMSGDYDLVLMDMQMPVLDGYSATRKLRTAGYSKPILALTAHAMADERKLILSAGCNAHLTKPLNPQLLIATIKHWAWNQGNPIH